MDTEIICALLEAKADINIKNKDGELPLDLAGDEKTKQFMIRWETLWLGERHVHTTVSVENNVKSV